MRTRSTTIRIDSITPTLTATIGHPEMNAFRNAIATATTVAELDAVVHAAIGSSDLMEFMRFDYARRCVTDGSEEERSQSGSNRLSKAAATLA